MNVEIGAEAALFPEKEYINGIAVAVWSFLGEFSEHSEEDKEIGPPFNRAFQMRLLYDYNTKKQL
jgi:hypothetical protein